VFESGAILLYLASHYDTERKFSFETGSNDESEALQWIFFFVSRALVSEILPYSPDNSMEASDLCKDKVRECTS